MWSPDGLRHVTVTDSTLRKAAFPSPSPAVPARLAAVSAFHRETVPPAGPRASAGSRAGCRRVARAELSRPRSEPDPGPRRTTQPAHDSSCKSRCKSRHRTRSSSVLLWASSAQSPCCGSPATVLVATHPQQSLLRLTRIAKHTYGIGNSGGSAAGSRLLVTYVALSSRSMALAEPKRYDPSRRVGTVGSKSAQPKLVL